MTAGTKATPNDLTNEEKFVLNWLSKEDYSSLGECDGKAFTVLVNRGLAQIHKDAMGRTGGYEPVSLTDAGWALLKEIKAQS